MRCGALDTTTTDRDVKLDSCRVFCARKSFIFGLAAANHGTSEKLFVNLGVDLLDLDLELGGVLGGGVSSVTFLPKELAGANERCWVLELPSDDIGPLVGKQGQVTVRSDPLGERGIHDGL